MKIEVDLEDLEHILYALRDYYEFDGTSNKWYEIADLINLIENYIEYETTEQIKPIMKGDRDDFGFED